MHRGVGFGVLLSVLTTSLFVVSPAISQSEQSENSPIKTWVQKIKTNPNDAEAWKGLGAACFETKRYDVSRRCFLRASKFNSNDAETLYYLGQLSEVENQLPAALKIYSRYASATGSPFREKMEERYLLVRREAMKEEMQKLLENEKAISAEQVSSQAVAVLPFSVPATSAQILPLGKGLAEMLITDLSQIKMLKLVERIRVQSLFDEMKLDQTGLVGSSKTVRFGKLLSAGRVVRGGLSVSNKNQIRMEAVCLNVVENQTSNPILAVDAINNLFRIEKDLALKVLNKLGIDPTPQEKERILKIPTQNLQAFIAYCNGLDLGDRGEFQNAANQYRKALQLDPNYSMAKQKLHVDQILARATESGTKGEPGSATQSNRTMRPVFDKDRLMSDRLRTIQTNIGSNFVLGKDARKPGQEAAETSGMMGGEDLTIPPNPPDVLP
jgi:tetratricopeptide (TPR) repeat protein